MSTGGRYLNASGLYCAPSDTSPLRARYSRAGDRWRVVDLSRVRDKESLLRTLAAALDFPAEFGHNWDALADALEDLSWLGWSRLVLEIRGSETIGREAPADWATALDILRGAATYWQAHNKAMRVLVHGAPDLPNVPA
jgi:hypothetical protein